MKDNFWETVGGTYSRLMEEVKKKDNKLEKLIKKFEKAVKDKDNEKAHSYWDEILEMVVGSLKPKLMTRLNKIRKGMCFWCA